MQPNAIARDVERLLAMPYSLRRAGAATEISIPMSGARAQDVSVCLEGRTVTVTLRVEHEIARGAPGVVTQESHVGAASRAFTFAEPFDASSARAALEHGVLRVRLPPGDDGAPRRLALEP